MSVERNPAERESPIEGREVKTNAEQDVANATRQKTAGRDPSHEIARQNDSRDSVIPFRSHKSISRLTGFPQRTDSREQIYSALSAWAGQQHE